MLSDRNEISLTKQQGANGINFLIKSCNWIFAICFYCVFIISTATVVKGSYIAGFLVIPVVVVLCFLYFKYMKHNFRLDFTKAWVVLQVLSVVVMTFMTYKLAVEPSWDWGSLVTTAYNYVNDGIIDNVVYYARYTNNQFWLTVLIYLFRLVKFICPVAEFSVFKTISSVISVIFVQITITFLYLTVRRLWGDKIAFVFGIITVSCLPFYLYAQFAYTDTPAMMLMSIATYLYLRFSKSNKKPVYSIILGLLGGLVFHVKVMGFILFIAIAIDMVLKCKDIKKTIVNIVAYGISIVAVVVSLSAVVSANIPISDEMHDRYKYPPTHWIMMGLNGEGGYDVQDVVFTMSHDTYNDRIEANLEQIKIRLKEKGIKGTLEHVFSTKLARTWGNTCMGGDDYIGRMPLIENGKFQKFFTDTGDWHWVCLVYTGIYHIIMIAGLFVYGIITVLKKGSSNITFLMLSLIGITVFLSIWECNSRYLLIYLPVILLVSFNSWNEFINILLNAKKHKILRRE